MVDEITDEFAAERSRLVERLASRRYAERESTREALAAVPRHEFVPASQRDRAYADRPLPIADDQTISAPHMVARMVDLLEVDSGDRVLEIGTGCGYHAAVTAEVVGPEHVFSVEYGQALAESARERLADVGYEAVSVRTGDGREGWPEHAPYDAAYFTCATPSFPEAVVEQVRTGGRLLAPIEGGGRFGFGGQRLIEARKREDGGLDRTRHGRVRFVTMRG